MATFDIIESFAALKRELNLLWAAETKNVDLGQNQMRVLYKLSKGPATMGELADFTMADKASLTRTVASLEKTGTLRRRSDAEDRRVVIIELTAKGRQYARKAQAVRDAMGERLDRTLSAAERKQFKDLVRKISENLNAPPSTEV